MGRSYSMNLILPWLFAFCFSASTAVKLSMFFSTLLFLVAFYFLARIYMPDVYAFLCSLIILTPMFDNIVSGMWYNYFALGCGLLFWMFCRNFYCNKTWQSLAGAILSFAAAVYSHPVGIVFCCAVLLSYILLVLFSQGPNNIQLLIYYILVPFIGLLLAAPQVQTILGLDATSQNIIMNSTPQNQSFIITEIAETLRRLFFVRVWGVVPLTKITSLIIILNIVSVFILFLLGIFVLLQNKVIEKILPLVCLIVINIILISRVYNYLNLDIGILRKLSNFYDRFQLISQIYLVLLSGTGLNYIYNLSKEKFSRSAFVKPIFILFCISLVFIAVRTPKKILYDHTGQLETLNTATIYPAVTELWAWLNNNVNTDKERVYFEDTYDKFKWNNASNLESKRTHVLALTSVYTKVKQIGGWCGFTTRFAKKYEQGTVFGKPINDDSFTDQFILNRMKNLNCKYIVVYSEVMTDRLRRVAFLKEVIAFDVFHVFENTEMIPAWAYNDSSGGYVRFIRHSSQHFELVADGQRGNDVNISMAYHPNYVAKQDKYKVPIYNDMSLMKIKLPTDGLQSIHFYYTFKKTEALSFIIAGVFLSIIVVITSRRLLHRAV